MGTNQVRIEACYPKTIPTGKLAYVLELITRANLPLNPLIGRFTLDFKKGVIRFDSAQRVDRRRRDGGLGSCIQFLNALVGGLFTALKVMLETNIMPEQALELAENRKMRAFEVTEEEIIARRYHRFGKKYANEGDTEAALWCLDQALRYLPEDPQILHSKATIMVSLERWEEALEFVERAIKQASENGSLWLNRGFALTELGRHEEALVSYMMAQKLGATDENLWDCKARSLYELGRFEEAHKAIEEALVLSPENAEFWNHKGCALSEMGRHDEALKSYERALRIDPTSFLYAWNRASAMEKMGRYESAREAYEMAMRLYEDFQEKLAGSPEQGPVVDATVEPFEAWLNIGNQFSDAGQWEEALLAYDRSLALRRGNPDALKGKGYALGQLGLLMEARVVYRRTLKRNPNDAEAWYNLEATRNKPARGMGAGATCNDKRRK
ncbi:MAG: tetratricopeptide repeat protein [Chloroflexota bacterium]